MSNKHLSTKFKKVLVLGIAVVGVIFLNKVLMGNQSELKSGFAIQPLSRGFIPLEVSLATGSRVRRTSAGLPLTGFSLAESGVQYEFYKDILKSYPEPIKFKNFEYPEPSRQNGGSYGAGKSIVNFRMIQRLQAA